MKQHRYNGNLKHSCCVRFEAWAIMQTVHVSHKDLGTRELFITHISDKHTSYQHDISPYVEYYDAVTGRRLYFGSGIT